MNQPERPPGNLRFTPVSAAGALEGLPIAGTPRLQDVELLAVVATTLRAAVDLALGDAAPRRPLVVSWDDGALDVRCAVAQPEALPLAGGLLETVEGSLGPAPDGRSEWTFRVPVAGSRSLFLMLQQGTLGLAVPWHSVLRVRLVAPGGVPALARRESARVVPPFVGVPSESPERPVVLLGLGLKRAMIVADRLVWRMPAEPIETGTETGTALHRAVRTLDGEVFWVVEPTALLRDAEPIPLPRSMPAAPPAARRERVLPETASPTPPPVLQLVELGAEVVEPLGEEARLPPVPARPEVPAAGRKALIAEDSIIGRLFLGRLLERRGFVVETVKRASELEAALARGPWTLLLVDVELPDSSRAEHLQRFTGASPSVSWVALTRDRDDESLAVAAGVRHSLRKPFEAEHLDRLLATLGLTGGAA